MQVDNICYIWGHFKKEKISQIPISFFLFSGSVFFGTNYFGQKIVKSANVDVQSGLSHFTYHRNLHSSPLLGRQRSADKHSLDLWNPEVIWGQTDRVSQWPSDFQQTRWENVRVRKSSFLSALTFWEYRFGVKKCVNYNNLKSQQNCVNYKFSKNLVKLGTIL